MNFTEMLNESKPDVNPSEIHHPDPPVKEMGGPSIRKMVVIKRTCPDKTVVFYQNRDFTYENFVSPESFKGENSDAILQKYSIKNRTLVKDHLEDFLVGHFGKIPITEFSDILKCKETEEIHSRLFVVSAYAVENYFGKPGPQCVDSNNLYMYMHKLFTINQEQENAYFEMAKQIHPPEFCMQLYLVEATGIKYESGCSYLYCKAWVNSEPKLIETTKPVLRSKHPVWNIRFHFVIKNLQTDVITIEVRDCEGDAVSDNPRRTSIKTFLERIFGKVPDNDLKEDWDLVGKIELCVRDVFSEGVDQWLSLTSSRPGLDDVFLHVKATFGVLEPQTRSRGIRRHLLLLRRCVRNSLENYEGNKKIVDWGKVLDRRALTLIFLHSTLSHLSESEDIMCIFIVVIHFGMRTEKISSELYYYLLHETVEHLNQFQDDCVDSQLKLMYDHEIENFYDFCFNYISSLHSHNIVMDNEMLSNFEFSLKSMYLLQNDVNSIVPPLMLLKSEAVGWYERKSEEMMKEEPENRSLYLKHFLNYLLEYQKALDQVLREVFPHETYTQLTFRQLEECFTKPLKFHITQFSRCHAKSSEVIESTIEGEIEMFTKMKEFVFYISSTVSVPALNLNMGKFREWFGNCVIRDWFRWRQMKAEEAIREVVKSDNLIPVKDSNSSKESFKESASARQTQEIIRKSLVELWALVSFPRSSSCDEFLVNSLHNCCVKYAHFLKDLISSCKLMESFFSGGSQYLCVLANNIWFTAVFVEETIVETVGQLRPKLPNTRLELEGLCGEMCSYVAERYLKDITFIIGCTVETNLNANEHDLTKYSDYTKKMVQEEVFASASLNVFCVFIKRMVDGIIKNLQENIEKRHTLVKDIGKEKKFFTLVKNILTSTKEIYVVTEDTSLDVWKGKYSDLLSELDEKIKN